MAMLKAFGKTYGSPRPTTQEVVPPAAEQVQPAPVPEAPSVAPTQSMGERLDSTQP